MRNDYFKLLESLLEKIKNNEHGILDLIDGNNALQEINLLFYLLISYLHVYKKDGHMALPQMLLKGRAARVTDGLLTKVKPEFENYKDRRRGLERRLSIRGGFKHGVASKKKNIRSLKSKLIATKKSKTFKKKKKGKNKKRKRNTKKRYKSIKIRI